jgi:hypothetical protein
VKNLRKSAFSKMACLLDGENVMKTIRVRAMLAFCFCALCVFLPLSARAGFPGNVIEAAGRIVQEPVKIVEKANEEATKVVTKVNKEATEGVKDVNKAVTEVATKANKEATEGVKDVNTTVTEIAADANQQVTDRLAEANTKVTKGVQRAAEQAKAFNKVVKWNLEKAGRDSEAEVGRFGKNLEDAAHAIGHFLERQGQGAGAALSNAERRIREGKVVDAIWHLSTEPLQHTSENAALAAQESEYLNTVAQTAASAYGGPAGAAAYAAWLTYEQTGNADLALRAGVLTYATSSAFSAAGKMNAATTSDIAKKAAVTAAIGGLAVAAAGGDETADLLKLGRWC